jgi:adenylate kinase family enzyme
MGDKIRRFIFLGAPGVGKGTFAKLLCKEHNLQHLSIG